MVGMTNIEGERYDRLTGLQPLGVTERSELGILCDADSRRPSKVCEAECSYEGLRSRCRTSYRRS